MERFSSLGRLLKRVNVRKKGKSRGGKEPFLSQKKKDNKDKRKLFAFFYRAIFYNSHYYSLFVSGVFGKKGGKKIAVDPKLNLFVGQGVKKEESTQELFFGIGVRKKRRCFFKPKDTIFS